LICANLAKLSFQTQSSLQPHFAPVQSWWLWIRDFYPSSNPALNQGETHVDKNWGQETPIDQIYLAAARVGGILANNTYPTEFIYQNLVIEANVIHAAFKAGVKKLLFLGSSCIYPKHADQPMKEEALLTGVLVPTNPPPAHKYLPG
jgi:GDP-L-fucose synthase